ncbi:MAG: hypothetical protein COA85_11590 [Robiginitomaculum sp.]|nr:MAG: hypothetical protein COA85_11590 [Robiginitomaculum sp.]
MRTGLFLTAGMLGIFLGLAGLPAKMALADEVERFIAPKMAVHNGDGARQNRESRARDNRRNGNHNGDSSRRGNRHRDNQNNQYRNPDHNRNDNARGNGRHNNQYANTGNNNYNQSNRHNRRDARQERRHARRDANHNYNSARHNRHDGREARRHERRHQRQYARNYYRNNNYYGRHNHSSFSFNLGYGSYGYGNRYGYPFFSGYDLYPWWYGDRNGYRSRTSYRSGYGHRGHSNIYCTDPYHQSYGTNWGRNYSNQFAYSSYTDGTYGGVDVRDCHRETHRGVYGRRSAIVSSMICYDNDSGDYYKTGAQTLIRYVY